MSYNNNDNIPAEIWYKVMSFLPLSQICRLGRVSKRFRALVTQHSLWKDVGERIRLDKTNDNETLYEIILKRYSKYICEFCGEYTIEKTGSSVCLPVIIEAYHLVISLCRGCRVEYYTQYPEKNRHSHIKLPMYTAIVEYALTESDLDQLPCIYNSTMKYYKESDVTTLSREIHGGDIGILKARLCSLNMFRIALKKDNGGGGMCSRIHARKCLITACANRRGVYLNYHLPIFQDYILFGKSSIESVFHESTSQLI